MAVQAGIYLNEVKVIYQNKSLDWSGKNNSSTDDTIPKSAASCILPEKCCCVDYKVQLKCGHHFPLMSAACNCNNSQLVRNSRTGMPVKSECVGKHSLFV